MAGKNWSRAGLFLLFGIVAVGAVSFALNAPPNVPPVVISGAEPSQRPTLVKMHAQWCPVCLLSKGAWKKLERTYGDRVDLVVFDLTNKRTAQASFAEAKRLGLENVFNEHSQEVGTVLVLERGSRRMLSSLPGLSSLSVYAEAIEEALQPALDKDRPNEVSRK